LANQVIAINIQKFRIHSFVLKKSRTKHNQSLELVNDYCVR
jgi:hypothetical protein